MNQEQSASAWLAAEAQTVTDDEARAAARALLDDREDREAIAALVAAPLEVAQLGMLAYREGRRDVRSAVDEVLGRAETIRCDVVRQALAGALEDDGGLDFHVRVHPTPDGPQPFPSFANTLAARMLRRAREYARQMAGVDGREEAHPLREIDRLIDHWRAVRGDTDGRLEYLLQDGPDDDRRWLELNTRDRDRLIAAANVDVLQSLRVNLVGSTRA